MEPEVASRYLEDITRFFPLLDLVSKKLKIEKSLDSVRIAWHCHLTEQTAVAVKAAIEAGAQLHLAECNPHTTSDGAVELMKNFGAQVFRGQNAIDEILGASPLLLSDTGLVLIERYLRGKKNGRFSGVLAAQEITTSGIARLKDLIEDGIEIDLPVLDLNSGRLKERIENYHAVGQGVVEALSRLMGRSVGGNTCMVVGYGVVGQGVSHYLKRDGLNTTVCESDSVRRLIAHYDGFSTMPDLSFAKGELSSYDFVVTATGRQNLISGEIWRALKDGVVVLNVGHWPEEIDLGSLEKLARERTSLNEHVEKFVLSANGNQSEKKVYVLTGGNPVNVVLLTGSPEPTLIHLSTELLALGFLSQNASLLKPQKQSLPASIEEDVAALALCALGKEVRKAASD